MPRIFVSWQRGVLAFMGSKCWLRLKRGEKFHIGDKMSQFYLRELSIGDVEAINDWRNNPRVIDGLGAPFRYVSRDIDEQWLKAYFEQRSNCVRLAICETESCRMIGAVYLLAIDWVSRSCEFAIWIGDESAQGQGAGKYATLKALEHAFEDLNLNRVYLTVIESNKRAMNLYSGIGFKNEGLQREAVYKNGCYVDMVMMSILKSEFVSNPSRRT